MGLDEARELKAAVERADAARRALINSHSSTATRERAAEYVTAHRQLDRLVQGHLLSG